MRSDGLNLAVALTARSLNSWQFMWPADGQKPLVARMGHLQTRPITAEDVLRCGSPYGDCELWDGAAVVCSPSGGKAEIVAARAIRPLYAHDVSGAGWVTDSGAVARAAPVLPNVALPIADLFIDL